jgi:hypothetical protein
LKKKQKINFLTVENNYLRDLSGSVFLIFSLTPKSFLSNLEIKQIAKRHELEVLPFNKIESRQIQKELKQIYEL